MNRIKFLLLIAAATIFSAVSNAQNLDKIGFYSQSGGDEFCQFFVGGTFGSVLMGEGGSLTITSEYMDTVVSVGDTIPGGGDDDDDDDNGIRNRVAMGEGISVYPNPTAYLVNVSVRDSDCASGSSVVEIYDAKGELVLSRPIANYGDEFSMDLSGLANGTYIMRIGKSSAKIVKR